LNTSTSETIRPILEYGSLVVFMGATREQV